MSKVKLILEVAQLTMKAAQDLRTLSDSVQAVCEAVTKGLAEELPEAVETKPEPPMEKEEPGIPLEKVRSVLAQKSEAGHTAAVKGIIQKYGANRLSEIDPKDYKAVLADAEEIGNG